MNRTIYARINDRLKSLKISARAACIDADLGPDVIRDIGRRPDVLPRLDTLIKLARVLQVTPQWLIFGVEDGGARPASPKGLLRMPVIGEVAAGLWHDVTDAIDEPAFPSQPIAADPRWPEGAVYGLVVRGTSINRIAREGDVLVCLDCGITAIEPRDGDVVIVERRRGQGSQKEVTAKVFRPRNGALELWPDSDDPRWTEPIVLDPHSPPDDDTEVAIIAIVEQAIRNLRR